MQAEVRFSPSGARVRVAGGTSLWEAIRAAGLPVASACGADGICGRCGVTVLEGAESLAPETAREVDVKRRNRVDPKQRLSCRVAVEGDLVITASYW
jgi:ferredoxin